MDFLPYLFIAVAGFVSGVLSGISGGGGGMLMMPALLLVGLPPQQAVATGKMNGIGSAFGGLSVFVKTGYIRRDILKVMLPIAIVVGVLTPLAFVAIDSQVFQVILGVLLVLLTPTLFIKKKNLRPPGRKHKAAGYSLYTGVLTLQAIFGSGVGSLALFILTLLLGANKLEANATKRAITSVLTPITFIALLLGGFVNLLFGTIGMVSVFAGTHLGSKIAIKKGEAFITWFMAVTIAIAGIVLVVNALSKAQPA